MKPNSLGRRAALAVLALWCASAPARAQSAENVLLVINGSSPDSVQIGEYYSRKRAIPQDQIVVLTTDVQEEIARDQFARQIEAPLALWLGRHSAHDRILYIVLTKGIPLRISGTSGPDSTVASVDSELALLYRKLTGRPVPIAGPVPNPYFLGAAPVSRAKPFTHEEQDIFLVTRLDGFSVRDVLGLIDRGLSPSREGKIVLDEKDSWLDSGNVLLQGTADVLEANGFTDRVVLDTTSKVLSGQRNVLGYYSWGSNDPANKLRYHNLAFVPGALAAMFVSSDGRTFVEPPPDWKIGPWENPTRYFAGSPQSLAGDLIREGVTGVAGHVAEPYLEATVRPNILFPAYLAGLNLAESFYLAIPYLSWQTVVVGDPLCAPFKTRVLPAVEIDKGTDGATEWPVFFSERRFKTFSGNGVKPDAVKLTLRAEARLVKQDASGARLALEQATALDDRLDAAHLILALMYERSAEYDQAIARYRRVLSRTPDNVVALNNLAYLLAVHQNAPAEALPLAQKAYMLLKGAANVADTLGWIYHLVGDEGLAGRLLAEAVQGAPQNAEVRLHAATVYAAAGQLEAARQELRRALELDPESAKRDDVKRLRTSLGALP